MLSVVEAKRWPRRSTKGLVHRRQCGSFCLTLLCLLINHTIKGKKQVVAPGEGRWHIQNRSVGIWLYISRASRSLMEGHCATNHAYHSAALAALVVHLRYCLCACFFFACFGVHASLPPSRMEKRKGSYKIITLLLYEL